MTDCFVEQFTEKVSKDLLAWVVKQRWFRSKEKTIRSMDLYDYANLTFQNRHFHLCFLEISYEENYGQSSSEIYFVPLLATSDFSKPKDALQDPVFGRWILEHLKRQEPFSLQAGAITFQWNQNASPTDRSYENNKIRVLKAEQSNTSILYGNDLIIKVIRKMDSGIGPESEMLAFLTAQGCSFVPQLHGTADYSDDESERSSLAIAQNLIPNQGDGWSDTLNILRSLYKTINLRSADRDPESRFSSAIWDEHFARILRLGQVTAELHLHLAADNDTEAFSPEVIEWDDIQSWIKRYHGLLHEALYAVKRKYTEGQDPEIKWVLDSEFLIKHFAKGLTLLTEFNVQKIRYHGDYHLEQALTSENVWMFFDSQGEPRRSMQERKRQHCHPRRLGCPVRHRLRRCSPRRRSHRGCSLRRRYPRPGRI